MITRIKPKADLSDLLTPHKRQACGGFLVAMHERIDCTLSNYIKSVFIKFIDKLYK